jgi:hypothetical protein
MELHQEEKDSNAGLRLWSSAYPIEGRHPRSERSADPDGNESNIQSKSVRVANFFATEFDSEPIAIDYVFS